MISDILKSEFKSNIFPACKCRSGSPLTITNPQFKMYRGLCPFICFLFANSVCTQFTATKCLLRLVPTCKTNPMKSWLVEVNWMEKLSKYIYSKLPCSNYVHNVHMHPWKQRFAWREFEMLLFKLEGAWFGDFICTWKNTLRKITLKLYYSEV